MLRQLLRLWDFDASAYLALYPDLFRTGNATWRQALKHWFFNGRKEGRIFPLRSDPKALRSHPRRIIIDVTTTCNLTCGDCNRFCHIPQLRSEIHLTPAQVEHFVRECLETGRQWDLIRLEGGEATLNPHFPEILVILSRAREDLFPQGEVMLISNGVAEKTKRLCQELPEWVTLFDSGKADLPPDYHQAMTVAPCDMENLQDHDFSRGCALPAIYGLGLTPHGYYPHPICGAIDRALGLNLGLKHLPQDDYADLQACRDSLCRVCGWYLYMGIDLPMNRNLGEMESEQGHSKSWEEIIANSHEKITRLTPY